MAKKMNLKDLKQAPITAPAPTEQQDTGTVEGQVQQSEQAQQAQASTPISATIDPSKTLINLINQVNHCTLSLKDKNLLKERKEELRANRKQSLQNIVYLTAAGIVNGKLSNDIYDVLRANVTSKNFKEPQDINYILKGILDESAKESLEGSEDLSLTELARLIETPVGFAEMVPTDPTKVDPSKMPPVDGINVIEITTNSGAIIVVDKRTNIVYQADVSTESPVTSGATKVSSIAAFFGRTWDSIKAGVKFVKDIVVDALMAVWNGIVWIATKIIEGIVMTGQLIYKGAKKVGSFITGIFGTSKPNVEDKTKKSENNTPANATPATA